MKIGVIDFETTGLTVHPSAPIEKQPYATEFAIAVIQIENAKGWITDRISMLINPGRKISDEIQAITGITNEELSAAEPFSKAFLSKAIAPVEDCDVLIAHNMSFDAAILRYELSRNGIEMNWPRLACSAELNESRFGRYVKMKDLYAAVLGRPLAQTHRAMDDVDALCEIILAQRLWLVLE